MVSKGCVNLFWIWGLAVGLSQIVVLPGNPAFAQGEPIQADNTLGAESSRVVRSGNIDSISGGAIRGGNLFHSFDRFNIEELTGAYFINPSNDIQNILSRVTGGNPSEIPGTLGISNNPGVTSSPNLIFSNPNGIVFGENASLDVPGSFVGTTADAVQFGEQGFFSATEPEKSSLLSVEPSALFFNAVNNQAGIVNRSTATGTVLGFAANGDANRPINGLQVLDGKSLLLVGGDVSLDGGRLFAPGGRVELGGLTEAGTVGLGVDGDILSLSFPDGVERGDVSLANLSALNTLAGGGGSIAVNAKNVDVSGGSQVVAGIGQGLGTVDSQAGDIDLNTTGEIKVFDSGSVIGNLVSQDSTGNGGNINIDADSIQLLNNAGLQTSTFGRGNVGNVTVNAKNTASLARNAVIFSNVEAGGVGQGGNININSASLSLLDVAQIQAITRRASNTQPPGIGDAGNVNIKVSGEIDIAGRGNAFPSVIASSMETGTEGNGGNITIDAGSLKLRDGAQLIASTFGQGNAGDVTIHARNDVSLTDTSFIFSTVEAGGVGKGGNININAANLTVQDVSQIETSTIQASETQPAGRGDAGDVNILVTDVVDIAGKREIFPSGIRSNVGIGTQGDGGNIKIDAGSFKLRDGAELTVATSGEGNAGKVKVSAKKSVFFADANIFSTVEIGSVGKGGNIEIHAASVSLTDGSQLIASTSGQGNAGNVKVRAEQAISLADNAGIFSTVEAGGKSRGGDIEINAASLSIKDGSLLASATRGASDTQPAGQGNAGNIDVKVTGQVNIGGEKNGFSSGIRSGVGIGTKGNGGNITINASSFNLQDRGFIFAPTLGQGNAGNIKINANEFVKISGSIDGIFGSGLYVTSTNTKGITGDIIITSPKITLDNTGTLNAESTSGNGGNINLTSDLLLLRRDAQISTNAGTAQQGGDGGNIDINSKTIVAIPQEDSDITANAFEGKGGNININTQGIFGIEPASANIPLRNDITASSELGITGNINLNAPDNSSIQNSLSDLQQNPIDTNALIANSCIARSRKRESTFNITGAGGLPQRPGDTAASNYPTGEVQNLADKIQSSEWKPGEPILEPQGVYELPSGKLILSRECS